MFNNSKRIGTHRPFIMDLPVRVRILRVPSPDVNQWMLIPPLDPTKAPPVRSQDLGHTQGLHDLPRNLSSAGASIIVTTHLTMLVHGMEIAMFAEDSIGNDTTTTVIYILDPRKRLKRNDLILTIQLHP